MHEILCSLNHIIAESLKDTLRVSKHKIQLSVCFILSFVFTHPLEKMSVTSTNVLTVTFDLKVMELSYMDDFSQKCPEWMQHYVEKSSSRFNEQNMSKKANEHDLTVTREISP